MLLNCSDIERRVKADYKEACEKLARLDLNIAMRVMDLMNNSSETYLDRIRLILVSLRKARSSSNPTPSITPPPSSNSAPPASNYRPYMKKLEPPDFRDVWRIGPNFDPSGRNFFRTFQTVYRFTI